MRAALTCELSTGYRGCANKARSDPGDLGVPKTQKGYMKNHRHQRITILVIILTVFLSGCATTRSPGPLGGIGDFLQDNPWAVSVLVIIIWVITRKK